MRIFIVSVFSFFFTLNQASAEFERGYADLVEELLPSVVSIATSQIVERRSSSMPESSEGHPLMTCLKIFLQSNAQKRKYDRIILVL